MLTQKALKPILATLIFFWGLLPQFAFGWSERGHHAICAVATRLVKTPELSSFLLPKGHMMGHLCNIPDISWRSLSEKETRVGNPTHYFEPDLYGVPLEKVPLNFDEAAVFFSKFTKDFPTDIGSAWWRAAQFYNLAIAAGKRRLKTAKQDDAQNEILTMVTDMGVMGHFVGDIVQPFHNTSDYDGWKSGHGGIHSYYEGASVDALPLDFESEIFAAANKVTFKKHSEAGAVNIVATMKELATYAHSEIPTLERLDPIVKLSRLSKTEKNEIKIPAVRKASSVGGQVFHTIIVQECARAALALAQFWDNIYLQAGKPDMKALRYAYPLVPAFVPPNYETSFQ